MDFSGGGYFRLTPYRFIKKWTKSSNYIMTYFHPRDFDPGQPIIKELSTIRKFKSYVGLSNCLNKLETWTSHFSFVDLNEADKMIDWSKAPTIKI